jgi:hypothetical protein
VQHEAAVAPHGPAVEHVAGAEIVADFDPEMPQHVA